jgi:class 3 adenylate cyclase
VATRVFHESFLVPLPVERTWEVLADTQHINELFFGLGALQVVARDAHKARIRGTFGILAPEYDEYPWIFEVPRRYKSVRVFTKGVLKRLETECTLEAADAEPAGDGGDGGDGASGRARTRVEYRVQIEAMGGLVGALAAYEGFRRTRAGFERARAFLEGMNSAALPSWPPANPQREAVLQRARAIAARIDMADDAERAALDRLLLHVADAPDADVARIRPYEVATAWGAPRQKVLSACLRATRGGLLRLSWDLLCPACEAPTSVASLKELPTSGHCPACDIDFSTSFEQNVEATFSPEPSVRAAERLVFCHGSPSSTKSWVAQVVVEPRSTHETQLTLGAGRYRLQAAGIDGSALLEVLPPAEGVAPEAAPGAPAAELVRVGIERLEGKPRLPSAVPPVRAGRIKIVIENHDDEPRRVQLAHRALASRAATAADVTATGLFRELFGGEALAPDQHVEIGTRAILFTDLCGSTAMYERVGDAAAYGLVREHFRLLFSAIEEHDGRIVKTVGDCVMAAFDTAIDAARAGRACILALRTLKDREGQAPGLALKVGVHAGSCLAVEANGQVDYFGRTVNIAARVESLASPDELVLSWTAVEEAAVQAFLEEARAWGDAIEQDRRHVKGIDGEVDIVRVAVTPA